MPLTAVHLIKYYEDKYGGFEAEIKLLPGTDKGTSISINLLKDQEIVWRTSLKDDVLAFKLQSLPPGKYQVEADVEFFDGLVQISLGPIEVEIQAGKLEPIKLIQEN
mgnify:CR=1 FL=1